MNWTDQAEDYGRICSLGDEHRDNTKCEITEQYTVVPFNLLNDQEWRVKHRSAFIGYQFILSRAIRAPGAHDTYDLYHRYYEDNKLASAVRMRRLADAFGYKETGQPRKWINQLYEEGAFEIDKIDVPGKPEPANIYILGHYTPKYFTLLYGNLRIKRRSSTGY